MPKEIERKFLIKNDSWKDSVKELNVHGVKLKQAYISDDDWGVVRLRQAEDKAYLTIKTRSPTIARDEFEYEIPLEHAQQLFHTLKDSAFIEKVRYKIPYKGHIWEVDEFSGRNAGLVIAELELESENESFESPDWIGEEVSKISKYFNSNLAENPINES